MQFCSSYEEIQSALCVKADVSAGLPAFRGDFQSVYNHEQSSSREDTYLLVSLVYETGVKRLDLFRCSPTSRAEHLLRTHPNDFRTQYGDQLATGELYGGAIYIILTLHSHAASTQSTLSAALAGSGAGWSTNADVSSRFSTVSQNASIDLTQVLVGGLTHARVPPIKPDDLKDPATLQAFEDSIRAQVEPGNVLGYELSSYSTLADGRLQVPGPGTARASMYDELDLGREKEALLRNLLSLSASNGGSTNDLATLQRSHRAIEREIERYTTEMQKAITDGVVDYQSPRVMTTPGLLQSVGINRIPTGWEDADIKTRIWVTLQNQPPFNTYCEACRNDASKQPNVLATPEPVAAGAARWRFRYAPPATDGSYPVATAHIWPPAAQLPTTNPDSGNRPVSISIQATGDSVSFGVRDSGIWSAGLRSVHYPSADGHTHEMRPIRCSGRLVLLLDRRL